MTVRSPQAWTEAAVEHVFRPGPPGGGRPDRRDAALSALRRMASWPGYAPTPLLSLDRLAADLGLGQVLYKDEAGRFGLGSFKAMGAAYATACELARAFGMEDGAGFHELADRVQAEGAPFAVACATDGNHGRAVAWAARRLGLKCIVFLHEGVSPGREAAIVAQGARVRRTRGNYDDSVREADRHAESHGWRIISDTAYEGYEQIPGDVMDGYLGLAAEIDRDLSATPTHIFVQAGVGGLAAAVFGYFASRPGESPVNVCVEPEHAACLLASARAGQWQVVGGDLDTIMAGLACGEPSTLAWRRIAALDVHFLAVTDRTAADAMRLMADMGVVSGESGGAGIAGLICAARDVGLREALGLDERSVVLTIGTEGATDPEVYRRIVGRDAAAVAAGERVDS